MPTCRTSSTSGCAARCEPVFPDLFATLAVPKAEELVATPYRHGSKEKAEAFFLDGMTQAMHRLAEQAHPAFPVTIYYAFKQSESDGDEGTASTGWDTFLDAVIRAGFAISGTWPMRTELGNRMQSASAPTPSPPASSSSAARAPPMRPPPRAASSSPRSRPSCRVALAHLQRGNIAPVDLAQAAIGPGMAVYTRYAKVLDAEGKPLTVREALALINQTLDEALAEQEGDFDADSRWALTWFEQSGFDEGEYGVAEQLSKSKNTSVAGMVEAGILESKRGKVRLLKPEELPADWDPATDPRLTAWEIGPPPDPRARERRRRRGGGARREARRQGRDRPRAGLPPLHPLRAQEARGRGARLQRPRAELAGDHPPGARDGKPKTRASDAFGELRSNAHGHHQSGTRRQGDGFASGRARAFRRARIGGRLGRQVGGRKADGSLGRTAAESCGASRDGTWRRCSS